LSRATSTRNGLQLVSYNPKTAQITVNVTIVPTEPPIVVTGTLRQSGIGLMQSWFYNKFATQADRQRAFADINAADVNLVSAGAVLATAGAQTAIDQRKADRALQALTQQSNKITSDQMASSQALQVKAAQQYLAMQTNLQNLSNQQSNYLDAFSGFVSDPFSKAVLNIRS
jgi:hypothetical protein